MYFLTFLKWFIRARFTWVFNTREKLINHQNKQLELYNKYLSDNYYRGESLLKKYNQRSITKNIMQSNFDYFNLYGFDRKYCIEQAQKDESKTADKELSQNLSFGLSSGTSGNRGIFISSKTEQIIWAAIIISKMLPTKMMLNIFNPFSKKVNIALFLRANNNLYTSINKFGLSLNFYDLSQDLEKHINQLNHKEIDILVAPASVILFLAQKLEKKEITIKSNLVISVAEVLEKKDYIEEQFNQKIHEIYQCTEGLLAFTCSKGILHLNESFIKFDEEKISENKFMPIITDFTRKSQFYKNYLHEDILVKGKECSCGDVSLTIEKIEGRKDEILIFDDISIFPDAIRKIFFNSSEEINNFIVSKNGNELSISLSPNNEKTRNEIKENFNSLLKNNHINVNNLNYTFYDYERKNYAIKNKRIFNLG